MGINLWRLVAGFALDGARKLYDMRVNKNNFKTVQVPNRQCFNNIIIKHTRNDNNIRIKNTLT